MQHKAKCPHLWFMAREIARPLYLIRLIPAICIALFLLSEQPRAEPAHGIAMHGELKYPANYTGFSYVSTEATRGGKAKSAFVGSFDSLNPLISKGVPIQQIRDYVYESLMVRAYDEPFSLYGLIAEKIETPPDRSWVSFTINKKARFSDGKPVTVDDVIFSHALLRDRGRPNHRTYYSKVTSVKKVGDNVVRFDFKDAGDREMPLIIGLMPVLPKHLINSETFEKTSLDIPVGSGPYLIKELVPGKSIIFKRDNNYWGSNLPANRGTYNFDEIQFEYYRDHNAMFEAFKRGLYHHRFEARPEKWALAYDFEAVKNKDVLKKEIPLAIPSGMDALVFNTRRPFFADKRVREALLYLFDAEWINRTLFHDLFARTQSFFDRSELSSNGIPADAHELKILAPYIGSIDKAIINGTYRLPSTDGTGNNRNNLRKALGLFREAGYEVKGGKLVNTKTGEPMSFEMLLATREQERLGLTYSRALAKAGIDVKIRQVDPAQYEARKNSFDFDIIQNRWFASLSPGNEQLFRWSMNSSKTEGSYNFPGVSEPSVDAMINEMLTASDRNRFVSAVRALDRLLISGMYMIPLFHERGQWFAHWRQLQCPEKTSLYGLRIDTCWMK